MTNDELEELAIKAGRGDDEAFTAIYNHKHDLFRHIILQQFPRLEYILDDLDQDIWLSIYRNLSTFSGKCSLSTWLWRVALNQIYTQLRREYRAEKCNRALSLNYKGQQSHSIDRGIAVIEAEDIIAKTPFMYRTVLRDIILSDFRFTESAETADLPYDTVRMRYRRGVKWLKSHAAKYGLQNSM